MPAKGCNVAAASNPPVRVFTLGRFHVEVNGAALRFGRKAQRRPLALLKLLIAYGGEGVAAEQIAADLWPEAEGDAANAALRTTISRLRRLIGPSAVLGHIHGYTLNPEACWVDALVLRQRLADFSLHGGQPGGREDVHATLEHALRMYQGEFLAGECEFSPVLTLRARLHSMVLRHLADLGSCHEQAGRFDQATTVYRFGLEIDAAAEEIARLLMHCYRKCGRSAEGIAVYRNCRDALMSRVGTEPSASTRAAYDGLLQESARARTPARTAAPPSAPAIGAGQREISIAVLPFDDLSPRGDRRQLAQAIRETVISLLGAVPQISLVTRYSPILNRTGATGLALSSAESPVRYLLRGSVMASGARLHAGVNLLDARIGQYVWSEQLDYALGDSFEAQEQIAIKVAEGLVAKLVLGQYPLILLAPDVQLWKTLTLAFTYLNRQGRQDYQHARVLLDRAMESKKEEPAVAMLSSSLDVCMAWKRLTPDPVMSLRASEQKLRRMSSRYGGYGAGMAQLGWACALRGDFDEALLHGRKAVDRMPELAKSHAFLGLPYQYQGRHAEALGKMNDAFDVCPQPPHWLYKDRALAQFCLRRYDEAARGLSTALVDEYPRHRDANLLNARMMFVASLAACGRVEEARHEAAVTLAAHPTATASDWCEWHFHPFRIDSPAQRIERLLVASGLPA